MNACEVVDGKLKIHEEKCIHCGRCDGKCPFKSITDSQHGFKIYIGGTWGKRVSHGIAKWRAFCSNYKSYRI